MSRPRRPVDPVDQLILQQDRDPRRRTTITVALGLESAPPWDDLLARVAVAIQLAPRLTERLVTPLRGAGPPEWAPDPAFDMSYHLRRVSFAGASDHRRVLGYAEETERDTLDPDRPLWRATMIQDPGGGRATVLLRFSHALVDGLAGVQLLASIVDVRADAPLPEVTVAVPPAENLSTLTLTLERLLHMPTQARTAAFRNTLTIFRLSSATLRDPAGNASHAVKYGMSLARMLSQGGASPSPALRDRSTERRFVTVEAPLRSLRKAARTAGGSLNDGYLAAVLGGLRLYHEALGLDVAQMPFAIPVSTRSRNRNSAAAGNRFAPVRFSAPVGLADPAERIKAMSDIVLRARTEPALDAMTALAPAFVQLPSPVVALAAGRAQDRLDAQASYVPGPPVPVFLAGSAVERIFALGSLPGPAIMAVLLTYVDVCTVGFTIDAAAVPDLDLFEDCMVRGFAEVLALA